MTLDMQLMGKLGKLVIVVVTPRESGNSDTLRHRDQIKYVGTLDGYSISSKDVTAVVGRHQIHVVFQQAQFEIYKL